MHELSLARNLIDQVLALAEEYQAKRIIKVTVIIGPFSGIVADSFCFGFDALKQDHDPTKKSILVIETPSPDYSCLQCGNLFTAPAEQALPTISPIANVPCPDCGSDHCTTSGGNELILKQLEME